MSIELWSINRWLRYTGWRVFVEVDPEAMRWPGNAEPNPNAAPTRIGLAFYGWRGLFS